MHKNSGLTIIELLVAITIAGILIAIAAPSLTDSMAKRSLEGIANELSADLHYSKSQAVSLNTSVSLITSANGYTVRTPSVIFKTITLDSRFTLTSPLTITFDPYRDFVNTDTAITLSSTQTSAQLQVKVNTMGRIQMCSPGASLLGYFPC